MTSKRLKGLSKALWQIFLVYAVVLAVHMFIFPPAQNAPEQSPIIELACRSSIVRKALFTDIGQQALAVECATR